MIVNWWNVYVGNFYEVASVTKPSFYHSICSREVSAVNYRLSTALILMFGLHVNKIIGMTFCEKKGRFFSPFLVSHRYL